MARRLEPSPRSATVTMFAAATSGAAGLLGVGLREARPLAMGLGA